MHVDIFRVNMPVARIKEMVSFILLGEPDKRVSQTLYK
ncbi:MAG: hypothetical protein ACI9MF_002202, partial [Gammaproteobacteria bacterium]